MAAGSAHVPRAGTTDILQGRKPPGAFARLVSDERLVARVRAGNEAAFALLWDRYQGQLLSFCRHMLGSHHEAEDAVQVVFANAYRDMLRTSRDLRVRPWLYRIARNQCISMLRVRRPVEELRDQEPSHTGLSEQVAGRAELRDLLRDLAGLPADQREALLLAELHDNSHADVAEIIGCDREKVKSLVFQARTSLIKSRQARDVTCEEIQRQLSVLRGGSLRRSVLRRHLADCDACRLFHEQVKQQRAALAIVLPVTPIGILKLGAAGALAASSGAGGTAAVGGTAVGSGVAAGPVAGVAAKLGVSAALVKGAIATVAVTSVAAGGVATVEVTRDARRDQSTPAALHAPAAPSPGQAAAAGGAAGNAPGSIARGKHSRNLDRRNGQAGKSLPQQRLQRESAARRQMAKRKQALVEGRRPNRRKGAVTHPVRTRPVRDKHPRRPEKPLPPRKQPAPLPEDTTELPLPQVP